MFGIYIYISSSWIHNTNLHVHPRLETGQPSLSRSAKKVDRVNFTCPSVSSSSSSSSMSNVEMLEQGWLSESEEESSFEWGERKGNGKGMEPESNEK